MVESEFITQTPAVVKNIEKMLLNIFYNFHQRDRFYLMSEDNKK